ncbi:hypothetical protein [Vibrio diabolicus]|nr:hypothetical protein [Vibrio diabolicus]
MIYDTQIISYCYSGHWEKKKASGADISSVTASEFLLFHTRENSKADYYVISPLGRRHMQLQFEYHNRGNVTNSKWAKMGAKRTDSIVIDLNNDFESYRMFGNYAISEIINNKSMSAFQMSIAHLYKNKQKMLKKKMEFLLDNNVTCHSLNSSDCESAMALLSEFVKTIQVKDNIKNTVNDLLILATAMNKGVDLVTEDKVLSQFASEHYNAVIVDKSDSLIVSFPEKEETQKIIRSESKGYINRGWQVSMKKGYF